MMKSFLVFVLAVQIANPCLTCPAVAAVRDGVGDSGVMAIAPCTSTAHGAHRSECSATASAVLLKSSPSTDRFDTHTALTVLVATVGDDTRDCADIGLSKSAVFPRTPVDLFTVLRI